MSDPRPAPGVVLTLAPAWRVAPLKMTPLAETGKRGRSRTGRTWDEQSGPRGFHAA
jgi:hypothetical protein